MAYYCIVTDVTIEGRSQVTVAYELRDDAADPHTVIDAGTLPFAVIEGEDAQSFLQRLQDNIAAIFRRLVDRSNLVGARAEKLKDRLVGRRYPAA